MTGLQEKAIVKLIFRTLMNYCFDSNLGFNYDAMNNDA